MMYQMWSKESQDCGKVVKTEQLEAYGTADKYQSSVHTDLFPLLKAHRTGVHESSGNRVYFKNKTQCNILLGDFCILS